MSERCENCGRFVTDQQIAHSDELGHSVCDHCADTVESVSDEHINTLYRYYAGETYYD